MTEPRAEETAWVNVVWACLITHVVTLVSCLVLIVFCMHLLNDSGRDQRQEIIERLKQIQQSSPITNSNHVELHARPTIEDIQAEQQRLIDEARRKQEERKANANMPRDL